MGYTVLLTRRAKKSLCELPKNIAREIYLELKTLSSEDNPKKYVKKLKGNKNPPFYSLRVGSYRVILNIEDNVMVIHVIEVGHRKNIYRNY
ncbi:type II toxin-antitoxin system RelE family toxin [Methanogenium organophilum]|uniref:Type II toxin-antitoxin system RelE/ParE family toxin n=1 Tax=Methanogenium organophilum TaxID=2199 RepID=A0A9X9S2T6_METOG|nr:type II toxin-antitoxin system RelE/ParE family toxin [Methanogenium organophilum]WAI00478.1 type II toxin-antitoxin system RelE/ParE family toxin [Methanogenium organophilum]